MTHLSPKKVLLEAQQAERAKEFRKAASRFAWLSLHLRKKSRFPEAKKLALRAIELLPKAPRLHAHLAAILGDLGDAEGARKSILRFCELSIHKGKLLQYVDLVESLLSDAPESREVFFRCALDWDRSQVVLYQGLSRSLLQQGKTSPAMLALLQAFRLRSADKDVLDEMQRLLSNQFPRMREWIARFEGGDLERAELEARLEGEAAHTPAPEVLPEVEKERGSEPSPPVETGESQLKDLIGNLEAQLGDGEPRSEAPSLVPMIEQFRKQVGGSLQDDTRTRIDFAVALSEMGLVEDALAELALVSEGDALYLTALSTRVELLFQSRSLMGAMDAAQQVLRLAETGTPEWIEAKYKLVMILLQMNDLREALRNGQELEKISPQYRDLRSILLRLKGMTR